MLYYWLKCKIFKISNSNSQWIVHQSRQNLVTTHFYQYFNSSLVWWFRNELDKRYNISGEQHLSPADQRLGGDSVEAARRPHRFLGPLDIQELWESRARRKRGGQRRTPAAGQSHGRSSRRGHRGISICNNFIWLICFITKKVLILINSCFFFHW